MNDIEKIEHKHRVEKYTVFKEKERVLYKNEVERLNTKYKSTTHYVLSSLVPYTEPNMKLSFSPRRFFNDLDKLDKASRKKGSYTKYRSAYYRAVKSGLIKIDGDAPRLTAKGRKQLKIHEPKHHDKKQKTLIAFDIPENKRHMRNKIRTILKEFKFYQVQKSVWESEYDCLDLLKMSLNEEKLINFVRIYEARQLR